MPLTCQQDIRFSQVDLPCRSPCGHLRRPQRTRGALSHADTAREDIYKHRHTHAHTSISRYTEKVHRIYERQIDAMTLSMSCDVIYRCGIIDSRSVYTQTSWIAAGDLSCSRFRSWRFIYQQKLIGEIAFTWQAVHFEAMSPVRLNVYSMHYDETKKNNFTHTSHRVDSSVHLLEDTSY